MKNKAKCRLCNSIIESFHRYDLVFCACGEIGVDGGTDLFRATAKDFKNFLRVDDQGNEIIVQFKENEDVQLEKESVKKLDKEDLVNMFCEMAKGADNLPQHAMMQPITHADFYSFMLLLSEILRK